MDYSPYQAPKIAPLDVVARANDCRMVIFSGTSRWVDGKAIRSARRLFDPSERDEEALDEVAQLRGRQRGQLLVRLGRQQRSRPQAGRCLQMRMALDTHHQRRPRRGDVRPTQRGDPLMKHYNLEDDFGRRTVFNGQLLVDEHTDTEDGRKPQWLEVGVWRTEGGSFVARRTTRYRVRHARETCTRAEGYELVDALAADTYLCSTCNKGGTLDGGHAQSARITVDVYHNPQELIDSFQQEGRYSNLARAILADLAEQDPGVDAAWSTVVVP